MLDEMIDFIAERIISLRTNREDKISARDMSLSLGQNPAYINKIETKQAKPSLEGLIFICEFLGVTLEEFFNTGTKHPDKLKELMVAVSPLDSKTLTLLIEMAKKIG